MPKESKNSPSFGPETSPQDVIAHYRERIKKLQIAHRAHQLALMTLRSAHPVIDEYCAQGDAATDAYRAIQETRTDLANIILGAPHAQYEPAARRQARKIAAGVRVRLSARLSAPTRKQRLVRGN